MQSGGRSGKLGDKYELQWVVRRLLELLAGNLRSVSIERIGEDERGVDLWITDESGVRTAEQCKRQNGQNKSWTIRSLETEEVIEYARFQLLRVPNCRYRFISTIPAAELRELSERASSTNDFETLLPQVLAHKELGPAFQHLCGAWQFNESEAARVTALALLKRCDWEIWSSGQIALDDLRFKCRCLVDAPTADALAHLFAIAFDPSNWGRDIDQTELCRLLAGCGLRTRNLVNDPRIPIQFEKLQSQYFEGFAERTAGEAMLVRSQVDEILCEITKDTSNRLLIVTGAAGYGKSAVLVDLAKKLREHGVPFLPFRLDDHPIEVATARAFGQQFDLPDSPGVVLGTFHKARTSVLLVDQLDAIRWNVSHSANSWHVFRDIVKEAQALGNVRVVVACRAFDLENDPLFKNWEAKKEARSFDIGELSEDGLKKDLGEETWNSLTVSQRKVLRRALNLHIWRTLSTRSGGTITFASSLDLMRAFWEDRHLQTRASLTESVNAVEALERFASLLQNGDEISISGSCIPSRLAGGLQLLQSLGIVRRHNGRILFWHQSLGDYLIAERVLRQFDAQTDIAAVFFVWLGSRDEQSLLRRGRAQLVLQLLVEARRNDFVALARRIISSPNTRFHIKLLALQVLADLSEPTTDEQQFVIELIADKSWERHAKREILHGRPNWLGSPLIKQLITRWAGGDFSIESGAATWLLYSVRETLGAFVVQCIDVWEKIGGEHKKHSDYVLELSNTTECDELFELRIRFTRQGRLNRYVHWTEVAEHDPVRFARLAAAWFDWFARRGLRWINDTKSSGHLDREWTFGPHAKSELEKLLAAARREPEITWQALFPKLGKFAVGCRRAVRRRHRGRRWLIRRNVRDVQGRIRGLEEILVAAGRMLAEKNCPEFLASVSDAPFSAQKYIARIVLRSLAAAPQSHAESIAEFLVRNRSYWGCGARAGRECWQPTADMLRIFSTNWSSMTFDRVERAIVEWRRPLELKSIKNRHRYGFLTPTRFGEAARFLLAALPRRRLSPESRGWLGCLRRKFQGRGESTFGAHPRGRGGFVGSSIKTADSQKFSDKTWLRLIANNGEERSRTHWGRRSIRESSAEMFAGNLETAADREPSRFARLALQMPLNSAGIYFEKLWWAFSSIQPKGQLTEVEKAAWKPASTRELEALHAYLRPLQLEGVDLGICRAITARPAEDWADDIVGTLFEYSVGHPSPKPEELVVVEKWPERTIGNLETTAINHVRSQAIFALAKLAHSRPQVFDSIELTVRKVMNDNHPSVQIALLSLIGALWNRDRAKSFELFERLVAVADDHIVGCHYAAHYMNVAQNAFADRFDWILCRMLRSDIAEVRNNAAGRICVLRWWFDSYIDYYDSIRHSNAENIRKGICEVLEQVIADPERPPGAIEDFARFFDDPSKEIRDMAVRSFYRWSDSNHEAYSQLARLFVGTRAFADDPTEFCHAANEVSAPILPIADAVFAVCESVRDFSRNHAPADLRVDHVHELPQLLLRIYDECEDAQDKQLQTCCLNAWDTLLESGVQKAQQQLANLMADA